MTVIQDLTQYIESLERECEALVEALREARPAVDRLAVEEARASKARTGLKPRTNWRRTLAKVDAAIERS